MRLHDKNKTAGKHSKPANRPASPHKASCIIELDKIISRKPRYRHHGHIALNGQADNHRWQACKPPQTGHAVQSDSSDTSSTVTAAPKPRRPPLQTSEASSRTSSPASAEGSHRKYPMRCLFPCRQESKPAVRPASRQAIKPSQYNSYHEADNPPADRYRCIGILRIKRTAG